MNPSIASSSVTVTADRATNRYFIELQALPAYALCAIGLLVIAVAIAGGVFAGDPALLVVALRCTAIVLLFVFAIRWIGFHQLADPIEQVMLIYFAGLVFALCAVIFVSAGAPLADPILRRADMVVFGIDRVRLIADLNLTPRTIRLWALVYNSLAVSPPLALIMLVLTGRRVQAWALLTAMLATGFVSIVFLAILPAHGTPPFPYQFIDVLDGFREGRRHLLDASAISGIVTFPSMHAADAILLVCAFRWLGRWAFPLVVLNVLMVASALVVGGHYVVDLAAGIAIALLILRGSLRLHHWLAKAAVDRIDTAIRSARSHTGDDNRGWRMLSAATQAARSSG